MPLGRVSSRSATFISTAGALNEQIDGASPGTYGQLQVADGDEVDLNGRSNLNVTLATDFSPAQNETFDIIVGQSTNEISGTLTACRKGTLSQRRAAARNSTSPTSAATTPPTYNSPQVRRQPAAIALAAMSPATPTACRTCRAGRSTWMTMETVALNPGEERAITDANGNFSFANLAAGNYTLREVLPAGWVQVTPGGTTMSYPITLSGTGDNASGENFVNAALYVTSVSHPSVVVGQAISNVVVAHFIDANTGTLTFTATITWADGTQTTGTVVPDAQGGYDVEGSYTYAAAIASPGGAPFTVSVTDSDGSSSSLTLDERHGGRGRYCHQRDYFRQPNRSRAVGDPHRHGDGCRPGERGSLLADGHGDILRRRHVNRHGHAGGVFRCGPGHVHDFRGSPPAATRSLPPTPAATPVSTPVRSPRPSPRS